MWNFWYSTIETQEAFLSLPKKDVEFLINKHFEEAILINNKVSELLNIDHPMSRNLYNWVMSSAENIDWYMLNSDNLKLVTWWINILWDVFELEDEKVSDEEIKEWIINYNWLTYFKHFIVEDYLLSKWKKLPNWNKYIKFLPWNFNNKVNFLIHVLWLGANWLVTDSSVKVAFYWTNCIYNWQEWLTNIGLNSNIISTSESNYHYRSLRCLKK